MEVVFSDLDGTLLDASVYRCGEARPALELLRRLHVPLVFVTSKTRAEVEFWRARLRIGDPFVVENGGAIFIPRGYFPFPAPGAFESGGYQVIELGERYARLVADLHVAAARSGVAVRGFQEMSAAEVSRCCGLTLRQARLAKRREYDEAFLMLDESRRGILLGEIDRLGRRCQRGGRFYHLTGDNDKAAAVKLLAGLFERAAGRLHTIGLGDAWNDLGFLQQVNQPVLMASPQAERLHRELPHASVTAEPGPAGWRAAVTALLSRPAHR